MKLLILSCSTGEGHNSAAHAMAEQCSAEGLSCDIRDPLRFAGERAQKFFTGLYNGMIRKTPRAFGLVYRAGELYDSTGVTSPVYLFNARCAEQFDLVLREGGYDAVLATHLYGMDVMTAHRKKYGGTVPFFGVFTDYTLIPFIREVTLDGMFVPHTQIKQMLVEAGVPGETVYPTGIPVSPRLRDPISREEARSHLGIPQRRRMFLLMSGGVGGGNVMGLLRELMRVTPYDCEIYVMAGKNGKLRRKIAEDYAGVERVHAVPFTREVGLYMRAADVMLSKPGGLSSSEAAEVRIPLVHINAIPGVETANRNFFAEHGMSRDAKDLRTAAKDALELTEDREAADAMRQAQAATLPAGASERILRIVKEIVAKGSANRTKERVDKPTE